MWRRRIGVGFLGAGPVTQSVHLPALARLSEDFEVTHVTDVDSALAAVVAARVGARFSDTLDALLADDEVDVVAICSPSSFHGEQVQAACRAGVKAVLCEKPFAQSNEEAEAIARTARQTGVPIVVGAMHTFDPAWLRALESWGDLEEEAHTVRSSIVMPGGTRFEDVATEVVKRAPLPLRDVNIPSEQAAALGDVIYGLIIHDLPLVRRLAPVIGQICDVRNLGRAWAISYDGAGRTVHLTGGFVGGWKPEWRLQAWSDTTALDVEFTPSYVRAGSGRSAVTKEGVRLEPVPTDHNGYEGEWREVAALARGERAARIPVQQLIDDLRYAVELADRSAEHIIRGARA